MAKKPHPFEAALVIFDQNVEAALRQIQNDFAELDEVPPIKGQSVKPKEPPYNPMKPGSF